MKKIACMIMIFALLAAFMPMNGFASEMSNVTYYDDGSYMTDVVYVSPARASGTVTGNRVRTYYNDSGTEMWKATLTGTFSYTGTTATCTASSCSVSISNSSWYVVSKSATKSGNTATASLTMGNKLLGITVKKVPITITLTCDGNGNLS